MRVLVLVMLIPIAACTRVLTVPPEQEVAILLDGGGPFTTSQVEQCLAPVTRGSFECANDLCEVDPKGKGSGQGGTDGTTQCIPRNPANNDATCAPFLDALYNVAAKQALQTCIEIHKVECKQKDCSSACLNTVVSDKKAVFLNPTAAKCAPLGQDACVLEPVIFDCSCYCPGII